MSWAMKMAVWGRTSSWGHRRTWKSCSLVCWRSPWAFSLLCPSCNTNNSQSPCKRTSKTVLLSPFVTFCKMWSASSAGMSTPSAAATVNPSLTLAFYHCHILGDRPLIKYCRLSIVVTPVVSRTFLHSLLYNKCIWSKRSILLPKDRQRLWTQESQTPHEGWWGRKKSEMLQREKGF